MESQPNRAMIIKDIIKNTLEQNLSENWDGKDCILELKTASENDGVNHGWKQMEWIGWYFEWKARQILNNQLGGTIGPKYRSVMYPL